MFNKCNSIFNSLVITPKLSDRSSGSLHKFTSSAAQAPPGPPHGFSPEPPGFCASPTSTELPAPSVSPGARPGPQLTGSADASGCSHPRGLSPGPRLQGPAGTQPPRPSLRCGRNPLGALGRDAGLCAMSTVLPPPPQGLRGVGNSEDREALPPSVFRVSSVS